MDTPPLQIWDEPHKTKTEKKSRKRTQRGTENNVSAKRSLFTRPELLEHLGRDWYFATSLWRGEEYFHFRVYEEKNGVRIPTPKGVSLRPSQLKQLLDCATTLMNTADETMKDPNVKEYAFHIGYGTYVTVKQETVRWIDIRRFFKPDGCESPVHTRKGAMLRSEEFTRFVELIPKIYEHSPSLWNIQVCDCIFGGNQMAFLMCKACNPFDSVNW